MAAQTALIRHLRRRWLWPIAAIPLAAFAFALSGWAGSMIPRNPNWREPSSGITIMIEDNGIHTGIVMPLQTPQKDWKAEFWPSVPHGIDPEFTHISISWGEKGFFLNTPNWRDLRPSTALHAIAGGEGLYHTAYYIRPAHNAHMRPITLRPDEYRRLAAAIARQIPPRGQRKAYRGYGSNDMFHAALGAYHAGNDCNQWTSDKLAEAGVKTGYWTPFAGGVMRWIARPHSPQQPAPPKPPHQ